MPIRDGKKFIESINRMKREIWYGDYKISYNVAEHPLFKGIARTIADLYDLQNRKDMIDTMTYESPLTGEKVGSSFLQPKTKRDLEKRRKTMQAWADYTFGFVARTPDHFSSFLMPMASAADYFGKSSDKNIDFSLNIKNYYEYIRENDLLGVIALGTPQVNREKSASKQSDPFLTARIVEERDDGLIVRGAKKLATLPIAEEILVGPSTYIHSSHDEAPYALAFALPLDSPGLKLICRQSFSSSSPQDNPLSSLFEELDFFAIFDDVFVPHERIFLLGDVDKANRMFDDTDAIIFETHQSLIREISKAEFMTGLAITVAEAIGADIFTHVQEKIAELIIMTEALKSFLIASEANATVNKWGILTPDPAPIRASRNFWPRVSQLYPSMIKQLGASGLLNTPPDKIFQSDIKNTIDKYYQGKNIDGTQRIKLFKLAWDASGSSFGSRQEMYERFFGGDPARLAPAFYLWYDKEKMRNKVAEAMTRINSYAKDAV